MTQFSSVSNPFSYNNPRSMPAPLAIDSNSNTPCIEKNYMLWTKNYIAFTFNHNINMCIMHAKCQCSEISPDLCIFCQKNPQNPRRRPKPPDLGRKPQLWQH